MTDPTASSDAEKALRELAISLQESQRIAGVGTYLYELKSSRWTSSDVLDEIVGIPSDYDRTREAWLALIHPADREMFASKLTQTIQLHTPLDVEYRITRPCDGAQRWIHGLGRVEYDESGNPVYMRGTVQDVTDKRRTEADLRQNEELLQLFIKHAPAALAMFDRDMRYIAVSRRWIEDFDLHGREIIGHSHYDLIPDIAIHRLSAHKRALGGETLKCDEDRFVRADGTVLWKRWEVRPWVTGTDTIGGIIIFAEDITARKRAEERLELAASVFSNVSEGIAITDPSGLILDVNDAFTQITGYSREEAVGRDIRILRSGRQSREFYDNMWRDLHEKGRWTGEIWNRAKNGRVFAEMLTISAIRDKGGKTQQYVALFSDMTAEKEHAEALERVAHYDLLTGLPNRVLLRDRLHHAMAQASRRGTMLAVVSLDLDDFKEINDNHGHTIGDQVLTTVAHRLKTAMREDDTLARLGGDEFIAVLRDFDQPAQSFDLVRTLLHAASQPVMIGSASFALSASAGVAFHPQAGDVDADQLMRQAGQALYQSKILGKNRYHVFDARLDISVRGRHEDLENIRAALGRNEFILHYQPKMNMATGRIEGAEALIRWRHRQRGLLPPAEFLPVVDGHPLAIEIGEWVIETALKQMETWRAAGFDIPVSVNISAQQLQCSDFAARLSAILDAHSAIDPARLEIEVLESGMLHDISQVSQVIHSCGRLGVSFALDDFGTGYSSLAYLKRLPVDVLKIDQTFVRDMLDDPEDLTIVEGMLGLATAFRRRLVAEGVETVAQGVLLLRLGCQVAQGFGIARPMPGEELPGWVASWAPYAQWLGLEALPACDRPLLYAGAELKAWVGAIEAYLHGKRRVPPSLDSSQCHLGMWLLTEHLPAKECSAEICSIDGLHEKLHECGAQTLALYDQGQTAEALEQIPRLNALCDELGRELTMILNHRQVRGCEPKTLN